MKMHERLPLANSPVLNYYYFIIIVYDYYPREH
jgi:hypothetical protein